MLNKINEIKNTVPEQYKDTVQFAGHVYEALEKYEQQHIQEVAQEALAGQKPDGKVEAAIHSTITDIKKLLMVELKTTVEDIHHIGDKHHDKNYKDGLR